MKLQSGVFALILSSAAIAQEVPLQLLDNYFDSLERYDLGFGAVTIYKSGESLYSTQFGKSLLDPLEYPKKSTRYPIGAGTKLFIAAATLKLVDEGHLHMNRPLSDFFPNQTLTKDITVKDLLQHRSGLPAIGEHLLNEKWLQQRHEATEYFELIDKQNLLKDKAYNYSNLNYVLLAHLLEVSQSKALNEIVQSQVVKPLKLKRSYVGPKDKYANKRAEGYRHDSLWVLGTQINDEALKGAFGMYSTAEDLGKLINVIFKENFLSNENRDLFLEATFYPGQKSLARDFELDLLNADTLDLISGNNTHVVYFSDKDLILILVINGIKRPAIDMVKELYDLLDGFSYPVKPGHFSEEEE